MKVIKEVIKIVKENKKCIICGDTFHSRVSNYEGEHKGEILCNKHLLQVKRNGRIVDQLKSRRREERVCDICGDSNGIRQFGGSEKYKGYLLCQKHYSQVRDHNNITDETHSQKYKNRVCAACGSEECVLYYAKDREMLCRKHYNQKHVYGDILNRTIFDKNEIVMLDNCAEVVMYNSKQNESGRVIVDLEKIEEVKNHKWYLDKWGYANAKINGKLVFMQNFIYGELQKGEIVDHIDRNPLNNKTENLRLSNKSTNAMNSKKSKNNTSGVVGVSYSKQNQRWRAYISYDGKRKDLGMYEAFEEAVKVRLEAEKQHHKEFACQKHLFEEYDV